MLIPCLILNGVYLFKNLRTFFSQSLAFHLLINLQNILHLLLTIFIATYQFKDPGAPNSAKFRGVAEGHPRFDKGGLQYFFYFLRVKNRTF